MITSQRKTWISHAEGLFVHNKINKAIFFQFILIILNAIKPKTKSAEYYVSTNSKNLLKGLRNSTPVSLLNNSYNHLFKTYRLHHDASYLRDW